jgi:uncharacterized protein YdhG (YjbR/CyaY superfamily)
MAFASVDDYVASLPLDARQVVERVREIVRRAVPAATETIRYDMPTFTLDGRSFVHVAAWKSHLGVYPLPDVDADDHLAAAIAPYRTAKGIGRFPYRTSIPYDLIERLVVLLATPSP